MGVWGKEVIGEEGMGKKIRTALPHYLFSPHYLN